MRVVLQGTMHGTAVNCWYFCTECHYGAHIGLLDCSALSAERESRAGCKFDLPSASSVNVCVHRSLPCPALPGSSACPSACAPCSRALVSSEQLLLPPELWVQTLRELLVPVATGVCVGWGWVGVGGGGEALHLLLPLTDRTLVHMFYSHPLERCLGCQYSHSFASAIAPDPPPPPPPTHALPSLARRPGQAGGAQVAQPPGGREERAPGCWHAHKNCAAGGQAAVCGAECMACLPIVY